MYQQKTLKQSLIENYKNSKQEEKINTFKGRKYNLPYNIIALYDENHKLHWHRPKSPNYEILSCSNDLSVKKWNLKSETCENTIYLSHLGFVKVLLMTFCDELITGSWDRNNNLKVWDLNGAYIRTLVGHTDWILSLIMLPNGNLMSGSRDSTIKTWDYHKGVVLKSIKIDSYWINCFVKSPITGEIISSSFDNHGKVKLWNSKSGRLMNELIGHSNYACCLIILPSGCFTGYFVTGSFDKTIKLWTRLGKCIKTLQGHTDWVTCLAVLKSPEEMLSGSFDKKIRLWNLRTGLCLKTLKGHTGSLTFLLVLPTGELLSSSGDDSIKIWNLNKGNSTRKPLKSHTNSVNYLTFHLSNASNK